MAELWPLWGFPHGSGMSAQWIPAFPVNTGACTASSSFLNTQLMLSASLQAPVFLWSTALPTAVLIWPRLAHLFIHVVNY